MSAEEMARRFHEAYERLAPSFGYKTREASAVPWEDVPEQNKALMIAVCAEMIEAGKLPLYTPEQVDALRAFLLTLDR